MCARAGVNLISTERAITVDCRPTSGAGMWSCDLCYVAHLLVVVKLLVFNWCVTPNLFVMYKTDEYMYGM